MKPSETKGNPVKSLITGTGKMVEAISRFQPIDTIQRNFKCPSKVQVGAVNFDDIGGEKK